MVGKEAEEGKRRTGVRNIENVKLQRQQGRQRQTQRRGGGKVRLEREKWSNRRERRCEKGGSMSQQLSAAATRPPSCGQRPKGNEVLASSPMEKRE